MPDGFVDVLNDPSWRTEGRFFGKYRGLVKDNKDPKKLGRIQATVPAVSAMSENWAYPCAPYAGNNVGFYAVPPVGAKVWIEFEGGNPNFPIWSGCFWQDDEVPEYQAQQLQISSDDPSQVKVLQTRVATLWIDDADKKGQVVLLFKDPSVSEPVTVKFKLDSTGLEISVQGSKGTSKITMNPEDIDSDSKTLSTTTSDDTTFTAQKNLSAKVTKDLTLQASGAAKMSATKDATVEGQNGTFSAQQNLTLQANSSAVLKGTTSVSVEGATAELKGSAAANVKAAVVNIN